MLDTVAQLTPPSARAARPPDVPNTYLVLSNLTIGSRRRRAASARVASFSALSSSSRSCCHFPAVRRLGATELIGATPVVPAMLAVTVLAASTPAGRPRRTLANARSCRGEVVAELFTGLRDSHRSGRRTPAKIGRAHV